MQVPSYFFVPTLAWASWTATGYSPNESQLMIGNEFFRTGRSKDKLDNVYPGFVQAVDLLARMGCDPLQRTSVLKFCIVHGNGAGLTRVLMHERTLALVTASVSLGLSGDEFLDAFDELTLDVNKEAKLDDVYFD